MSDIVEASWPLGVFMIVRLDYDHVTGTLLASIPAVGYTKLI